MNHLKQKQKAFAIYQVGIVLVLVAISFAAYSSYFNPYYSKKKVNIVAEKIASQIHFLRFRSIADQTRYSMKFVGSSLHFKKRTANQTNSIEYNPNFNYRINGSGTIYFYPNGRTSFLSVFVTSKSYTRRILLAATGRTRFQ